MTLLVLALAVASSLVWLLGIGQQPSSQEEPAVDASQQTESSQESTASVSNAQGDNVILPSTGDGSSSAVKENFSFTPSKKKNSSPWSKVFKGKIYSTSSENEVEEFKAGKDIPAGTYLFHYIPGTVHAWVSIQLEKGGHLGCGGGDMNDDEWATLPVCKGQVLLASGVAFCNVKNCKMSKVKKVTRFKGMEPVQSASASGDAVDDRYYQAAAAAESLQEEYPNISWSSLWEEMQNLGFSDDEISWAIG